MFSLKCMRVLRCIFPPFMHVALTSPDDRTLFMYSRKDSSLISLSVKMKLAPLPCWPAVLYKPFRSSIKLAVLYDLARDGAHKRCFSSQKRLTIYSSESPAVIQWESPNPLPLQKDRGRKTSRCLRMMRHEWNVHAKPPEKTLISITEAANVTPLNAGNGQRKKNTSKILIQCQRGWKWDKA